MNSNELQILVVDDIPQNLYMLDFMLRNAGYHVLQAVNGKQALDILKAESINLIVSDILMPEMDGYQFCRECKADDTLRAIPFIFYTATYTSKDDETFALSLGAARFILKPQQPAAFLSVIHEVLQQWKNEELTADQPLADDSTYLKLYNQRLIHKLEDKLEQLAQSNQKLTAELALRKKAEKQNAILLSAMEHADEGIIICETNGNVIYVNAALSRITGYNSDLLMSLTPEDVDMKKQAWLFYQQIRQTIANGQGWQGKLLDRRLNGATYPAMLSITPVLDEGNGEEEGPSHYIAIIQDMTEQEALEERFQQAQKLEAIGTLAGGVAHDFNNFLATVGISTYLAEKQIRNPEAVRNCLRDINTASERAAELVKQMLTFARKDKVKLEPIVLKDAVNAAVRLARAGLPANIRLNQHLGSNNPYIMASITQIEQIILNMINNARDALEHTPDPEISIRIEEVEREAEDKDKAQPASYARLIISDNGEGIRHTERIFEPFYTTKEQGKGTGLGLAMVYGSVTRHHGFITVESQHGKGCRFVIDLPITDMRAEEAPLVEDTVIDGKEKLILLADDEDFVRQTMQELLQHLGFSVVAVSDGKQAVDYLQAHPDEVELTVLDVIMPVMGGMDAARAMRKTNAELPVIFITGYDRQHVLDLEHQRFPRCNVINKPFRIGQLSDALSELLPQLQQSNKAQDAKPASH